MELKTLARGSPNCSLGLQTLFENILETVLPVLCINKRVSLLSKLGKTCGASSPKSLPFAWIARCGVYDQLLPCNVVYDVWRV